MLVAEAMTEETSEDEYARYATCKVDVDVLAICKAAAALDRKKLQEWISDHLNLIASKELGRKPVKRLPPPPRR